MIPQGATFQIKAHIVRSCNVPGSGNTSGLQARHRQADARLPSRWASSSTHSTRNATAVKAKPAASIIATLSPPSVSDQRRDASDTFIPLTKARKLAKSASTDSLPSRLQQAGKAARYAVLTVGIGVAMKALAFDITDVAIASAILAAGMYCSSHYVSELTHTQLMLPHLTCAAKQPCSDRILLS